MIRDEVNDVQEKFEQGVELLFDDIPNKDQFLQFATAAWETFSEGKDLQGLSKEDIAVAFSDVLLTTAVNLKTKYAKYSDEKISNDPDSGGGGA